MSSGQHCFASREFSEGLSARTPERVEFVQGDDCAYLTVELGEKPEFLLLAGSKPEVATMQASAAVSLNTSLQIYFGWKSRSEYFLVHIGPVGAPEMPRFRAEDGGTVMDGCEGETIPLAALADSTGVHDIELRVTGARLALDIDGFEVLDCSFYEQPQVASSVSTRPRLGAARCALTSFRFHAEVDFNRGQP
ncbi:MAG: hypothetical protein GY811_04940 [Myxococcales bacterium]|nr:hypothetical protein [Myxococcales bacterium]